jgi:hypothetical protein
MGKPLTLIPNTDSAPFWSFDPGINVLGSVVSHKFTSAQPLSSHRPERLVAGGVGRTLRDGVCATIRHQRRVCEESGELEVRVQTGNSSLCALFYSFNSAHFTGLLEQLTGKRG